MGLLPHEIAEIAAAAVCTVLFFLNIQFINTKLLVILWLTVIVEQFAKLITAAPGKYLLYNIFTMVECCCYAWFLSLIVHNITAKKVVRITAVLWLVMVVVNIFFGLGLTVYNQYIRIANSLLVTICCLFAFWQLAVSHSSSTTKVAAPAVVAVAAGLILFYCGSFFLYISFAWLLKNYTADAVFLYKTINHNLNIALYSLICMGLLLERYWGKYKKPVIAEGPKKE